MHPERMLEINEAAALWKAQRNENTLWKQARLLSTGEQVVLVACLIRDGFSHDGGAAQVLARNLRLDLTTLGHLDPGTGRLVAEILGWVSPEQRQR